MKILVGCWSIITIQVHDLYQKYRINNMYYTIMVKILIPTYYVKYTIEFDIYVFPSIHITLGY